MADDRSSSSSTNPAVVAADPHELLGRAFHAAIVSVLGDAHAGADPLIRPAQNPDFGDFQSNCAMPLAKAVGSPPREIAEKIAAAAGAHLAEFAEPPTVAGPGFINISLKPGALRQMLDAMQDNGDLGVPPAEDTEHAVVIDMCSVNVAKQMHVGHLRSTIIGDALGRVFERRGVLVHRQNHLGDWGLQIGMVLHQLRAAQADLDTLTLPQLEAAYRDAQLACKGDERGLAAAAKFHAGPHRAAELEEQNAGAAALLADVKETLVRLQQGEEAIVRDWRKLIDVTMRAVYEVIHLLGVKLTPESERGESFYRDKLGGVIESFKKKGLAKEDAGAIIVPFEDRERPLLIQKSDGGYLYATTDLAAVRFRARELNARRVLYVVDARQRDHFRDVFDAAKLIGWHRTEDGSEAELVHLPFGAVLGSDKRPLKTRAGRLVTLRSLLDEAIARGVDEVVNRAADEGSPTHGLPRNELEAIGRAVGIGAVKYADLSNDLVRDYEFDMDRMIAFEGNTGPYMQYAHARICSMLRKADTDENSIAAEAFTLAEPAEKNLALALLRYGPVVVSVAESLEPHRLCGYLHDLANTFSTFYQQCPVLKSGDEAARGSRLRLCLLTRDVLRDGLSLLGIEAPPRM